MNKKAAHKKVAPDAMLVQVSTTTGPTHLSVTALLGPNGAVVSKGYGGWNISTRPRATGLTFWQGAAPFEMSLQLVLDNFIQGGIVNQSGGFAPSTVDDDCFRLEQMALPPSRNDVPPIIDLNGAAVPRTTTRWILQDIQWEDVERRSDGARIRQVVTLTLVQFVQDTRLKASKRAKQTSQKKKQNSRGGPSTPV
jgi:hypothetical protein